jgi:hypothetical protein
VRWLKRACGHVPATWGTLEKRADRSAQTALVSRRARLLLLLPAAAGLPK